MNLSGNPELVEAFAERLYEENETLRVFCGTWGHTEERIRTGYREVAQRHLTAIEPFTREEPLREALNSAALKDKMFQEAVKHMSFESPEHQEDYVWALVDGIADVVGAALADYQEEPCTCTGKMGKTYAQVDPACPNHGPDCTPPQAEAQENLEDTGGTQVSGRKVASQPDVGELEGPEISAVLELVDAERALVRSDPIYDRIAKKLRTRQYNERTPE